MEGNLDPKHWVEKSDPLVLMRSVPFSLGELYSRLKTFSKKSISYFPIEND